jgi:hypothetical protein
MSDLPNFSTTMIPLNSAQWKMLETSMQAQKNIPELIAGFILNYENETFWTDLWQSVCDSDRVYPVAFATIPHLIDTALSHPHVLTDDFFAFIASCEINRQISEENVPEELASSYQASLSHVPHLVAHYLEEHNSYDNVITTTGSLAAIKGYAHLARMIITVDKQAMPEILSYYQENQTK